MFFLIILIAIITIFIFGKYIAGFAERKEIPDKILSYNKNFQPSSLCASLKSTSIILNSQVAPTNPAARALLKQERALGINLQKNITLYITLIIIILNNFKMLLKFT